MDAATRIRWRGIVASRGEASGRVLETGDVVLVSRDGQDRWLVFRCPSGCGTELPINLDIRTGPAWRIYNAGPRLSLYPSVWRDSGCNAHFILSRGRLWLLGTLDQPFREPAPDQWLIEMVKTRLGHTYAHYLDVAESLGAEPWETLWACRFLVRRQEAIEGRGPNREQFAIIPVIAR